MPYEPTTYSLGGASAGLAERAHRRATTWQNDDPEVNVHGELSVIFTMGNCAETDFPGRGVDDFTVGINCHVESNAPQCYSPAPIHQCATSDHDLRNCLPISIIPSAPLSCMIRVLLIVYTYAR